MFRLSKMFFATSITKDVQDKMDGVWEDSVKIVKIGVSKHVASLFKLGHRYHATSTELC